MIEYDVVFHSGDTGPDFTTTVERGFSPIDVSTATSIRFQLIDRNDPTATPKVNAEMTVDDGPNGLVSYRFGATDLDTTGRYWGMVQVTWPSGVIESFPDEYLNVLVVPGA